jgi:EmrB/QacA subfamily drug resistance transporter
MPQRVRTIAPAAGPPVRSGAVLAVILTAQIMVVLDATIVNVALPQIQARLHFSSGSLSWVLNAYILVFGGLLLLGARAGDLLGRRRAFVAGIALFSVGSLAGGLAERSWMLLAARAVQGVGGALVAPSSLSLLTSVFAEGPRRVRAIGLYATVSAAGSAVGLVAGGVLTQLVSWRWVMFVNVPIGAVALLGALAVVPETPRRRGRFDLAGALASTAGVGGVVLGLVNAGSDGWGRARTLLPLLAGAALVAWFIRHEAGADEPILPLVVLTDRARASANAARALVFAGVYGTFYFLAQYLQDVEHYDPLRAGLAFLPWPFALFVASQLASRVLPRILSTRSITSLGIVVATSGVALAAALGPRASYGQVVVGLVLIGVGAGMAFVHLTARSLSGVEPQHAGAASGLVNVSQQLGAALGLAVLVTIFGATAHGRLAPGAGVDVMGGLHAVFAAAAVLAAGGLALAALGGARPPAAAANPAPAALPAAREADAELVLEADVA